MNISTSSDLAGYARRNRTALQLRAQIDTVSQETVTGLKSDVRGAVNGELGRAHLMQKAQSDLQQAQELNTISANRLETLNRTLINTRETVDGIGTRGFVALNAFTDISLNSIVEEAEGSLRVIMAGLTTASGDRNLLSGDKTNSDTYADPDVLIEDIKNILETAPSAEEALTSINAYFDTPGGEFDTKIYLGGDGKTPPLPAGGGQFLQPEFNGKNQEFKDTLKGLAIMALSQDVFLESDREGFATLFTAGTEAVTDGESGLISLEADVGIMAETTANISDRNQDELSALSLASQNIFGRDQYEAAAELQQLQVQLEASYTITSRLSSLNLTNFLR